MICPFSGKPCLKNKDAYVKIITEEGNMEQMYLCDECVKKHIDKLNISSRIATVSEIFTENSNHTTVTDIPLLGGISNEDPIDNKEEEEENPPLFANINYDLIKEIEILEAKYEESLEVEDYETAKAISTQLIELKKDKPDTDNESEELE